MKRRISNYHRSPILRGAGFTIIELLIVIVVIGILAAITIIAYNGIQQKAHLAALQSDLSNAAKVLGADNATNGSYPATIAAANDGKGLQPSPGNSFTYNSNGTTYCLSESFGTTVYRIVTNNNTPVVGSCSGVLADGTTCPSGFIVVPGNSKFSTSDFCVMKYEAKQVGSSNVPISQATGTPWVNISQTTAIANSPNVAGCTGCHLMTEAEWMTVAANVLSVPSNWSGNAVGSGYIYSGHNDNSPASALAASPDDSDGYNGTGNSSTDTTITSSMVGKTQRRTLTLTNGAVIWDLAGNVWEWTNATITGGQPGSSGIVWRDWNNLATQGALAPSTFPSYANVLAGNWTYSNGIGMLFSASDDGGLRGFIRGGFWGDPIHSGVFALNLYNAPSALGVSVGFRVTR